MVGDRNTAEAGVTGRDAGAGRDDELGRTGPDVSDPVYEDGRAEDAPTKPTTLCRKCAKDAAHHSRRAGLRTNQEGDFR